MRRNTWTLVGLATLALATAALVLVSLLYGRPGAVDAAPTQPLQTNVTVTVSPTPSPSPPTPPRAPRESTISNIQQALIGTEPVKILVLGDGSGLDDASTQETRWVTRWAESRAEDRPVTVAALGRDGMYAEPRRFGIDHEEPLEILNASDLPSTLAEAAARADTLIPADVDLVIINFGHREQAATQMAADLDALWDKLPPGAMGLVIAQNPERGNNANAQRDRAQAVTRWAEQRGVPSVDVFNAFIDVPEPLVELLSPNQMYPSNRGSEVWRDAVDEALE